ncbi:MULTISPECIES: sensor histidine kinase [Pseudothermotoga]|nr:MULTISPECIES: HAMP domain-containing sensor histidine kinase [Pseudothermotoga]KUK21307.1 MAG: Histidine kinase [Pseudothermotoga lettingae]MDI3494956.1 hypothetical protein [Pseudothermotoga sp.]MDK2884864.1 hypothetical protein [Pseudothermotoga sp.]GLI48797.1 hypothetical protein PLETTINGATMO_09660 [Pseudothermotoga lettingae TMO]
MSDINWHEIAEKYKPLMVLKPDVIIFYPSNGGIFEEKQILSDSKTFFVNAVAHELFTPITALLGLLQIAKEGEYVQETLGKMEKHLKRMQRIIEQLVLLSKLEQQEYIPEKVKINLKILIDEVISEYDKKIKQKNLFVHIKVNKIIKTDTEALKIALANLISNAIKYSNQNGDIIIHAKKDTLIIEDKGVGIPEEDLKNITARFYRASNARTFSGSGLGLAIVKHILRKLSLSWAIHSIVDKGTKIFLEIP